MTAIVPRKPISKWLIGTGVFAVLGIIAAVILSIALYNVQEARIDNLHTALAADRTQELAAAGEQQKLLENYTTLYNQVVKNGDQPKAPAPSTIQLIPGPTGAAGQNATDTQVLAAVTIYCDLRTDCQGPTGLQGPAGLNGADGAQGPPGPAGADGVNGTNGVDGQPPVSWTYTDAFGIQHTCSRTDQFDPSSPTYSCS